MTPPSMSNSSNLRQRRTADDGNHKKEAPPPAVVGGTPTGKLHDRDGRTISRRATYIRTQPPALYGIITSHRADAVLASLGAGLCVASLLCFHNHPSTNGYNVYAGFVLNASLKFFYNREPPNLQAFVQSTVVSVAVGWSLHAMVHYHPEGCFQDHFKYFEAVATAVMMLYWKLYGSLWTPANSLAVYLAVGSGPWTSVWDNEGATVWYLLAPYTTGHIYLYSFAVAWSYVRTWVRAKLVQREFFSAECRHLQQLNHRQQRRRLRDLFDRMDLDHNGRLDVHELQLAFRSALGGKDVVSLEECRLIMKSTDTDGDMTLDFDEFRAALDKVAHGVL